MICVLWVVCLHTIDVCNGCISGVPLYCTAKWHRSFTWTCTQILKLMKSDSHPKFVRTPDFKEWMTTEVSNGPLPWDTPIETKAKKNAKVWTWVHCSFTVHHSTCNFRALDWRLIRIFFKLGASIFTVMFLPMSNGSYKPLLKGNRSKIFFLLFASQCRENILAETRSRYDKGKLLFFEEMCFMSLTPALCQSKNCCLHASGLCVVSLEFRTN